MTALLTSPVANALAWALVHFLWQGAALGLAAFLLLRVPRWSSNARYAVGVATLALMVASAIATTAWLVRSPMAPVDSAADLTTMVPAADGQPSGSPGSSAQGSAGTAPLAVLLTWALGVAALSTRLAGGWMVAQRFTRRAVRPVSSEIRAVARRIATRLAITRAVQVLESTAVAVPMMVGWVKPVVLLPAAALGGLSPLQIEALLAHELAHVRRHDYLVNLLQAAVETLLFYHPAVWWVSRQVREEREHCCDDLAIAACGDRLGYAAALADLAAMTTPRFALAASDGSLLSRVRRILGQGADRRLSAGSTLGLVVILAAGALVPVLVTAQPRPSAAAGHLVAAAGIPDSQEPRETAVVPETREVPFEVPPDRAETAASSSGGQTASRDATREELQRELERVKQMLVEMQHRVEQGRAADLQKTEIQRMLAEKMVAERADDVELRKAFSQRFVELEEQRNKLASSDQSGKAAEAIKRDVEAKLEMMKKNLEARAFEAETTAEFQRKLQDAELMQKQDLNKLYERQISEVPEALRATAAKIEQLRATAVVSAGDVLTVQVIGADSQLTFSRIVVGADGTVKVPVTGSIKVTGLTVAQAREGLQKSIAAKSPLPDRAAVSRVVVTLATSRGAR